MGTPAKGKVQMLIYLDRVLRDELRHLARHDDRTLSAYVVRILQAALAAGDTDA